MAYRGWFEELNSSAEMKTLIIAKREREENTQLCAQKLAAISR